MNERELNSLTEIINYMMLDERKHWEEQDKPKEHIYKDLLVLQKYESRRNKELLAGFN